MCELICSDNMTVLGNLSPTLNGRVHLAYLDPPFATGKEQIGRSGRFTDSEFRTAGDVVALATVIFDELLHESGSLVVHMDWRLAPSVRVALDATFGIGFFASEIIWSYKRWPTKTANFQRTHDTLLRYVRCPGKQRWNQLYQPLAESTLKTFGVKRQRAEFVSGKRKRSLLTDKVSLGAPLGDVWQIPIVAPVAKERTGYPTQKPEALLERLILATTNEGDLVLDPYAGSGTTLAVAKRLGREAIGIDRNQQAIDVARRRICA